jgi:hypothetical protein
MKTSRLMVFREVIVLSENRMEPINKLREKMHSLNAGGKWAYSTLYILID